MEKYELDGVVTNRNQYGREESIETISLEKNENKMSVE